MPNRRRRPNSALSSALSKVLVALPVLWLATSAPAQNIGSVDGLSNAAVQTHLAQAAPSEVAPSVPSRPQPPVPPPLPPPATRRLPIAPDLVGLSVANAEARVRAVNLALRMQDERTAGAGTTILSQDPKAGTRMRPRGIITVRVRPAVVLAEVPDIIKRRISEAERAVVAAKLQLRIANESRSLPDTAVVISQEPPPHRYVRPGSTVTVTVTVEVPSQTTFVPQIVGLKIPAAEDRLRPSLVLAAPPTGRAWPSGATVAMQSPEVGQRVPVGSFVTVTVTVPPPPPAPTPAPTPTPPSPAPTPTPPTPAPPTPPAPSPVTLPNAPDLLTPVLWSVAGILLVALLGIAAREWRRRHRTPLPVRISLGREPSRGRVVGRDGATLATAPVIGVRLGAGPSVTTMRPITRSD
jgi:beta-lactam-binding protein with PASTA domain